MANLKEVKNRIASVTSTQQITKAMKMVAAAKLRKAQEYMLALRPYYAQLEAITTRLVKGQQELPPVSIVRPQTRVVLLFITSDKGLCGNFNSTIVKAVEELLRTTYKTQHQAGQVQLMSIGKRGRDYFRRRKMPLGDVDENLLKDLNYAHIAGVAEGLRQDFLRGHIDEVLLVYNAFKSIATQILRKERFLPFSPPEAQRDAPDTSSSAPQQMYLYEPSAPTLLEAVLPYFLKTQLYRAVLDSNASEQGTRMTAMDKATENAEEMLKDLRLAYNRTRQSVITTELLEIVAGAEALAKG